MQQILTKWHKQSFLCYSSWQWHVQPHHCSSWNCLCGRKNVSFFLFIRSFEERPVVGRIVKRCVPPGRRWKQLITKKSDFAKSFLHSVTVLTLQQDLQTNHFFLSVAHSNNHCCVSLTVIAGWFSESVECVIECVAVYYLWSSQQRKNYFCVVDRNKQ